MHPKSYIILSRAVEEGVAMGWRRAFKHTDQPGDEVIHDQITQEVLNAICEVFDFDDVVKNDLDA